MLTPGKAQCQEIRNRDKASNDLYLTTVSRVRKSIESFFNWLIQKTDNKRASNVSCTKELFAHLFD